MTEDALAVERANRYSRGTDPILARQEKNRAVLLGPRSQFGHSRERSIHIQQGDIPAGDVAEMLEGTFRYNYSQYMPGGTVLIGHRQFVRGDGKAISLMLNTVPYRDDPVSTDGSANTAVAPPH